MKLQLDTVAKTIKLENNIVFSELIEVLEKLLPKGEWKKFTLETHTTINNWNTPVIIEKTYPRYYPWYDKVWCSNKLETSHIKDYSLKAGTYNVQC